jgi:hypothetical protein
MVMPMVNYDSGPENVPGTLHPGIPPGRIILPPIRRTVNLVRSSQNVLNGFPVVHVDIIVIIRQIASSAIGIAFTRFDDNFFSVEIFISDNLQDGFPPTPYLNFNNGDVLDIIAVHYRLENYRMVIPLPPMFHPDVINPAVIIQIQVVDPILFRIEFAFKIS